MTTSQSRTHLAHQKKRLLIRIVKVSSITIGTLALIAVLAPKNDLLHLQASEAEVRADVAFQTRDSNDEKMETVFPFYGDTAELSSNDGASQRTAGAEESAPAKNVIVSSLLSVPNAMAAPRAHTPAAARKAAAAESAAEGPEESYEEEPVEDESTSSVIRGNGSRDAETPAEEEEVVEPEEEEIVEEEEIQDTETHDNEEESNNNESYDDHNDPNEEDDTEEDPSQLQQQAAAPAPAAKTATATGGTWRARVQAWIYPGNPACNAHKEFKDGRTIHVLKPEYFTIADGGSLELLTVASAGCSGYSAANAAEVRQYSSEQFVTISSNAERMRPLVTNAGNRTRSIDTLVAFVQDNQFTGVELDFEGYAHWNQADYEGFKTFVRDLGNRLHAEGKKLQVDAPPISNAREQGYYLLSYEDLAALPIDQIVIMAYDYMYDHGNGTAVAPNEWVSNIARNALSAIGDADRVVVGIPSYGYRGTTGEYSPTLLTHTQIKGVAGYASAATNADSHEKSWSNGGSSHFYTDSAGLNAKREMLEALGVRHVSVWHLGGNDWFSGKQER